MRKRAIRPDGADRRFPGSARRMEAAPALVVTHKSAASKVSPRAERIPSSCQVVDALEADPKGLGTRFAARPLDVTAQARRQMNHLCEPRWLLRGLLTLNGHPHRFPFRRFEDGLTFNVRASPTHAAGEQDPPRHNQVQPQTGQRSVDVLETPPLDAAARFQRAEQDFD